MLDFVFTTIRIQTRLVNWLLLSKEVISLPTTMKIISSSFVKVKHLLNLLIVINKNRQQRKRKDSAGFDTSEGAAALEQQPTLAEPSQRYFLCRWDFFSRRGLQKTKLRVFLSPWGINMLS